MGGRGAARTFGRSSTCDLSPDLAHGIYFGVPFYPYLSARPSFIYKRRKGRAAFIYKMGMTLFHVTDETEQTIIKGPYIAQPAACFARSLARSLSTSRSRAKRLIKGYRVRGGRKSHPQRESQNTTAATTAANVHQLIEEEVPPAMPA